MSPFKNAGYSVYREDDQAKEAIWGSPPSEGESLGPKPRLSHPGQEETELHALGLEPPASWPLARPPQLSLSTLTFESPLGPGCLFFQTVPSADATGILAQWPGPRREAHRLPPSSPLD